MMSTRAERPVESPSSGANTPAPRPASRWAARWSRGISGFVGLFLLFDGGARLVHFGPYLEGTVEFGFPEAFASPIGLTLLLATTLYLIPRTAVLGAILLTGYLGGAAASHVQRADPWFLFPVVLGALAWAALYLRDQRIRELVPLR